MDLVHEERSLFALFALSLLLLLSAEFLSGHKSTPMRLHPLGSFVQRKQFLLLLCLLDLHKFLHLFAPAVLFLFFSPCFLDGCEVVLLFLEHVILCSHFLLMVGHLLVVLFQNRLVVLVLCLELGEALVLILSVGRLCRSKLVLQSLELVFKRFPPLLVLFLLPTLPFFMLCLKFLLSLLLIDLSCFELVP